MGNCLYKSAALNEWMIVIKNGELKKSGIGLKTFINPVSDTVATFPSSVNKVPFCAEQVTKEMQGVQITGVVMWSVNRIDDGPFRFYKYAGQDMEAANENLRMVSESIVRNAVANSSIKEVMSQRDIMRTTLKKGIMEAVQGWGMWIETVELTDVKICSRQLFEDLQAEFRQEANLQAQRLKMMTQQKVAEEKLSSDQALVEKRLQSEAILSEKRVTAASETKLMESRMKLKLEVEEQKLHSKQMEIERAKLQQQKEIAIEKIKMKEELERKELDLKVILSKILHDSNLDNLKETYTLESSMSETSKQFKILENAKEVYKTLKLSNITLHNYVGAGGGGGVVESILPAFNSFTEACNTVAEKK